MIARDIDDFAAGLFPAASRLQPVSLTPQQRQALGGHLFSEAPAVVRAVGRALSEHPDLFTAPTSGPALLAAQERADAWAALRHHLADLLQIATDAHLLEQSGAITQALAVLRQDQAERALPLPRPDARQLDREFALCEARLLLDASRRRKARRGRRPAR